jgi:hypothetical protein
MAKFDAMWIAVFACALSPFLQGAAAEREATYGENVYVNCQYRFAAIFPRAPMIRDMTYTIGGKSAPARQFSVEQGANRFSVVIANFASGPPVDEQLVEAAAVPLRQSGRIIYQAGDVYDPGIPGRQINALQPNGLQHRASVYMHDHRLYVTESVAVEGDFPALQFEQSVSIIDANGTDLDKNGNQPSRQYDCRR